MSSRAQPHCSCALYTRCPATACESCSQATLVPSLLQLYVDIEYTDRGHQFYEKFHMRMYLGEVLAQLWQNDAHKAAWHGVAKQVCIA